MTQTEENEDQKPWRSLLTQLASVLTIIGLVGYAMLSITYERFYRALGISPSDVGLTYAGTLASSVGMLLALGVLTLILVLTTPIGTKAFHLGYLRGSSLKVSIKRGGKRRYLAYLAGIVELLVLLIGLYWGLELLTGFGTDAADAVKSGRPVVSPHLGPTALLAIHADPALIQSTVKRGENPGVDSLQGRYLFFLGQANGNTILYDSSTQRSIFLPTPSIVLQISNCTTNRSRDALCSHAYGGNFLTTRSP